MWSPHIPSSFLIFVGQAVSFPLQHLHTHTSPVNPVENRPALYTETVRAMASVGMRMMRPLLQMRPSLRLLLPSSSLSSIVVSQRRTLTRVRTASAEDDEKNAAVSPPAMSQLDGPETSAPEPLTEEAAQQAAKEANLDNRISFVGSGAMASAILGGLLRNGRTEPDKVCVCGELVRV